MGDTHQLFESLFRPRIGEETEVAFLKQLTADHPYFSPAQFFLLQRTNTSDPVYAEQAARTALLFNNHFWLNLKLQEANDDLLETSRENYFHGHKLEVATDEFVENELPDYEQVNVNTQANTGDHNAGFVESREDSVSANEETETEIETSPQLSIPVNKFEREKAEPVDAARIEIPVNEEDSFVEDYTDTIVEPTQSEAEIPSESQVAEEQKLIPPVEEIAAPMLEAQNLAAPTDGEEAEIDPTEQTELAPIHVKLNLQQSTVSDDTLTFEPLHTTDYFASQGIKLSSEIQSTDKLGKQLRSFTEWLKTMKKVHTDQPADNVNQTDVTIQKLAEKSNAEDEVVTEAMADVLIQQGKKNKAREVYRKLSLLNPAKTAYFAAKIDQLKE